MDPNKTLEWLRDALDRLPHPDTYAGNDHWIELALQAARDLDNWLSNGGYLPKDWQS